MKRLLLFFSFIAISAWPMKAITFGNEPISCVDKELFGDSIIIAKIEALISKQFHKRISDLEVSKQYATDLHLYWNDPGFKEGPTIAINKKCWVVKFQTCTYNNDGSLKYRDYWAYCVPLNDSLICRFNNYHGDGYHGGSRIMFKSQNDKRFEKKQYESFVKKRSENQENFFITLVNYLKGLQ